MRQYPTLTTKFSLDKSTATLLNQALKGKMRNVGQVTLTPDSSTTILEDPLITTESVLPMMPMTANAAQARLSLWQEAPTSGQMTLHHASSSLTDRTFRYVVIG